MTGMTFNQLKRTMAIYDEIEFSYRGEMYDFQKEPAEDSRIKISVWHCTDKPECVYSVTIADGESFVEDLIGAKIFPDGKSIAEAQSKVEL